VHYISADYLWPDATLRLLLLWPTSVCSTQHYKVSLQLNTATFVKYRYGTGTVRYGTVRYGTVRYGTVRYGTVRYGTVRYGTVRYGTVRSGI
jgi:hypothetical protein